AATRVGGTRANIRVPSIRPGAIQLTVIEGASATAMQRVRWMRPALDTARAMLPAGARPGTPEMFTMRPWALRVRCGVAARVMRKGPRRFVFRARSQTSGVSPSRSAKNRVVPGCIVDQDVEAAECLNRLFDGVGTRSGVSLIQVNDEGSTPFFLDLVTQVESFVAVAEMSHGDMHTVISEHPRRHRAKTATRTGNEGNAIMQIHNDASCELPTFHKSPLLPNARGIVFSGALLIVFEPLPRFYQTGAAPVRSTVYCFRFAPQMSKATPVA